MSLFSQPGSTLPDDDLVCVVCATPLLNKQTVCPKCGNKWGQTPKTNKGSGPQVSDLPAEHYFAVSDAVQHGDDLLTTSLIFIAGMGVLFAVVNLFVSRFGLQDIWRSWATLVLSMGLLGLRRLILK